MRSARRRKALARATTRIITRAESDRERLMRQMAEDIRTILRDPNIPMTSVERLHLRAERMAFLQHLPKRPKQVRAWVPVRMPISSDTWGVA